MKLLWKLMKISKPSWSRCCRPASIFPRHIPQTWDQRSQFSLHNLFTVRARPLRTLIDNRLLQRAVGPLIWPLPSSSPPSSVPDFAALLPRYPSPVSPGSRRTTRQTPSHGRRQQNKACLTRGHFSKVSLNCSSREEWTRGGRVWKV